MAEKKSVLEEALLDIKNIQNALNANTKEILRSVAREEIDSVVKESLKEEIYTEEDVEEEMHMPEEGYAGTGQMEGMETDLEEMYMDEDMTMDEEMDLTDASDDEVIAIYKKLSGDDEIEIVGDEMKLNISEPGEYIVKNFRSSSEIETMDDEDMDIDMDDIEIEDMDDMEDTEDDDMDIDMSDMDDMEDMDDMGDMDDMEDTEDDDMEYEIEIDDEEGDEGDDEEESEEDLEEIDEEELEEITEMIPVGSAQARRTPAKAKPGQPYGAGADNIKESIENKNLISETTKKYNTLLTETQKLKEENEEFRKALKEFRTKLVETVVFNSNLTYVTKLFMEHSTTKVEKENILKRFDTEVSTIKESKKLYKTISNELTNRKPINESVENRFTNKLNTSVSKQLNENTAYVDQSTKRIIDLINRVEKK